MGHSEISLISIFQEFSSNIHKAFILAGGGAGWALGYRSMGFRQVPDIY